MFKKIATCLGAAVAGLLATTQLASAQTSPDSDLVTKGAYVARLGDCIACHTAINGKAYAGGLAVKTPVGTIYSTNITPDATHGIGSYTLKDFDNAVRKGIRKDGSTLYPAMPYSAFSRMTDDDIKALYAYFMHGVKAVPAANKETEIPWPMSMRWPLAIWRSLLAPEVKPFQAASGTDPVVARGAYIVEGPGHCGMCHTPRGMTMQEKALTPEGGAVFLSGGAPIDNWIAPSLRNDPVVGIGRWSEDDLVRFLRSGRTDHAAVFGGMADVVGWSTQYFTDEDLHAMAKYLKSLPPVPASKGQWAYDASTTKMLDSGKTSGNAGADLYVKQCAICHRNDGGGVARMFPPLAGNPVVMTDDPTSMIHIVAAGGVLPPTNWAPSAVAMPGYRDHLSDREIADVVDFIRTSWGNKGLANVSEADVKRLREEGQPIGSESWGSHATAQSVWGLFMPQPYGHGWTFAPDTHTGQDNAQ
ncbi:cytochrome c [Acetobacter sp. AN02]|uniref:cytochrome c n=1 Tax=Acetobacter sp. AN02 TaxID=2894186 RepID=UPI00243443FB|nr:cytochrome c [Acetobacter sp. AN02]MDG6094679.1 cytochrome c [Acetobacter sp. AN02]